MDGVSDDLDDTLFLQILDAYDTNLLKPTLIWNIIWCNDKLHGTKTNTKSLNI